MWLPSCATATAACPWAGRYERGRRLRGPPLRGPPLRGRGGRSPPAWAGSDSRRRGVLRSGASQ
eukprot:330190-Heterocapsa_arctica.AAC.1